MNSTLLFSTLERNAGRSRAIKMSAYMRAKFVFLGLSTPKRKALCRSFWQAAKKENYLDWTFVMACWQKPPREFQYTALDYLFLKQNLLRPGDLPKLKKLAVTKSWWDTIDGLARLVGGIALNYPEVKNILLKWSAAENFWLRRIAIDHQLLYKTQTDPKLLARIIVNNLGQTEFFINKAIGWSLREYSKTAPAWVR
ncbi:MAG: DNA alkylation repair protein, partial [Candidatus Margulisbacteria bacterium]|nr:DNA alkylation repair protein [Candidatus Margulisiibacteriota bacterium]